MLAIPACSSDRTEKVGGTGSYTSSNIISCLIALYTRLALLTCRLAQGSYVQAVSCHESLSTTCTHLLSSSSSTPNACAILKQSQVFERRGTYGIDDALQNQSCPIKIRAWRHLFMG